MPSIVVVDTLEKTLDESGDDLPFLVSYNIQIASIYSFASFSDMFAFLMGGQVALIGGRRIFM